MTVVDAGPLVAVVDPRDRLHSLARRQFGRLAAGGLRTCEAVLVEACFHLPHPAQRQRLRGVLEEFDIRPLDGGGARELWADVLEWLLKYAGHEPDWADGCLAVLSERHDGARVWTYDREFRTTWRRPNGTAIPLVPSTIPAG